MDHGRLKIGIVWSSGDERSHHQLSSAGQPPPPPTTRKQKKKKMRRITVCVLADGCCCCYNCAGSGTCANYLAVEIVSFCVEGVVAMVITTAGDMFRPLSFFFFLPSSSFTTQEKSSVEVGFRFFSILGIQHPSTRTGFRLLLLPQLRSLDFHGQFLSTERTPVKKKSLGVATCPVEENGRKQ